MNTEDIKITPPWGKSKEEIWNDVFANLKETDKSSVRHTYVWRYAAAAVIAIIIAGTSFAYLYQTTEYAPRGSHLAVTLPDGSEVSLNADSELKYKPYWWSIARNAKLQGEAFFEVKGGKPFTVASSGNTVRVLGTSFNVFSRSGAYSVTCISGKIEVELGAIAHRERLMLTPNMQINYRNERVEVADHIDTSQSIDWIQNRFTFIGVPLIDVLKEIERQYDIHVSPIPEKDYLYTGHFSKEKEPEKVLEIIGKPFGLTFKIEP